MQGELFDYMPELRFWTSIIASSHRIANKSLPHPVNGPTVADSNQELPPESTLEIAYMLRTIADHLETKAVKRQNLNIQLDFEARNEVYR